MLAKAIMRLAYIWKLPASNLGRDTNYIDRVLYFLGPSQRSRNTTPNYAANASFLVISKLSHFVRRHILTVLLNRL
jgi:hypothetical protein